MTNPITPNLSALLRTNPRGTNPTKSDPKARSFPLSESLTGALGSAPQDANTPLALPPAVQAAINNAKSHLTSRRTRLTSVAQGILDGSQLVDKATAAIKNDRSDIKSLHDLVQEAADPATSTARRADISKSVKSLLQSIDDRTQQTRHGDARLLAGDIRSAQVAYGEQSQEALTIHLPLVTLDSLKLKSLDVSTADAAKNSLALLDSADSKLAHDTTTLTNTHNRLLEIGKQVETKLKKILASQGILSAGDASTTAQQVDPTKLPAAQSPGKLPSSLIASLLGA